ncbi:hypothetical protein JAAARDRAFT_28984 [Jaapia argillacea MUCL 33604]|uniref:Uncharacterized protein n=1 Tax=Jaapia argillacea MUCL 33604 TaxID=933084 RepID=A0A067QK62_9AGAM|nr:hypothetical protein JAAARDRAFT_28984 [Jaapia argillacea MUCL 33604]
MLPKISAAHLGSTPPAPHCSLNLPSIHHDIFDPNCSPDSNVSITGQYDSTVHGSKRFLCLFLASSSLVYRLRPGPFYLSLWQNTLSPALLNLSQL